MDLVWVLAAYILFIGAFLFIMLFGESPSFDGTVVQAAHAFITSQSCELIQEGVRRVCGARAARLCSQSCDAFLNKPNPVLQIFYLALIGEGWFLFAYEALPLIPGAYLSAVHRYTAPLALLGCLTTFLLTSFSDPGVLTPSNIETHLRSFKIDNQIYVEKVCVTCQLQRPARSKHCSVCNRCIARFDHHCGWMNTCIGEKNIRFFVAFLVGHTLLCWYGTYLIVQTLRGEVERRSLIPFLRAEGFLRPEEGWWGVFALVSQWLLAYYSNLVMLGVFALVISLLVASFAGYHLYLIAKNTTTNETYKWAGYQRWLWEEAIAKEKAGSSVEGQPCEDHINSDKPLPEGRHRKSIIGLGLSGSGWFSRMRRRQETETRVPKVKNAYDHGLLENLKEILIPRSTRTRFLKVD